MSEKRRLTAHNARAGKHGVFNPKHNDRNFDTEKAPHIDKSRTALNRYWVCDDLGRLTPHTGGETFDKLEHDFYEAHFAAGVEAANERALKARHKERVTTPDEYRKALRTAPEEMIWQIGDKDNVLDVDKQAQILADYLRWERQAFPQVRTLDVALHCDEEGAPHFHVRRVWLAHDDEGNEIVHQGRALAEMGVTCPKAGKRTRNNNPKMAYTMRSRAEMEKIASAHGVELELTRKEPGKTGLDLVGFQAQQEQLKAEKAKQEQKEAQKQAQKALQEAKRKADEILHEANKKAAEGLLRAKEEAKEAFDVKHSLEDMEKQKTALREEIRILADQKKTLGDEVRDLSEALELGKNVKGIGHLLARVDRGAVSKAAEEVGEKVESVLERSREYHKDVEKLTYRVSSYQVKLEQESVDLARKAREEYDRISGPKEQRMANYMKSLKMNRKDGTKWTVWDAFKEHERKRVEMEMAKERERKAQEAREIERLTLEALEPQKDDGLDFEL